MCFPARERVPQFLFFNNARGWGGQVWGGNRLARFREGVTWVHPARAFCPTINTRQYNPQGCLAEGESGLPETGARGMRAARHTPASGTRAGGGVFVRGKFIFRIKNKDRPGTHRPASPPSKKKKLPGREHSSIKAPSQKKGESRIGSE